MASDAPPARARDGRGDARAIRLHEVSPHTTVATLVGAHDLSTQQQVIDALVEAIGRPNVIVDLSYCTFIDTTILDALYATRRAQEPGRDRIVLVIPDHGGFVNRWSQLTGASLAFPTHTVLEDALESVGEQGD